MLIIDKGWAWVHLEAVPGAVMVPPRIDAGHWQPQAGRQAAAVLYLPRQRGCGFPSYAYLDA